MNDPKLAAALHDGGAGHWDYPGLVCDRCAAGDHGAHQRRAVTGRMACVAAWSEGHRPCQCPVSPPANDRTGDVA